MLFRQANVCFLPQRFCDGYLVHKAHTGDKVAARWISIGRSHNPADRNQPACFGVEWKGLPRALRDLGIALVGTVFIGLILARFLPKTSLFQKLVSQTASGVSSVAAQEAQQDARIGQIGVAISQLYPGGKAQFGDQILDVLTQGEIVEKGRPVKIIGHTSNDAVVEEAG